MAVWPAGLTGDSEARKLLPAKPAHSSQVSRGQIVFVDERGDGFVEGVELPA